MYLPKHEKLAKNTELKKNSSHLRDSDRYISGEYSSSFVSGSETSDFDRTDEDSTLNGDIEMLRGGYSRLFYWRGCSSLIFVVMYFEWRSSCVALALVVLFVFVQFLTGVTLLL